MHDFNWDDVRHFLEVVERGSVLRAAEALGVNQTTVSRRVSALEKKLGANLFDRGGKSWVVTPAGESIREAAEGMAEQAQAVQRHAHANSEELSGKIRVTAPDACTQKILMPGITEFLKAYPAIDLEFVAASTTEAPRDVDVAVSGTDNPPQNLVGKRIGMIAYTVYGNREWLDAIRAGEGEDAPTITWIGDGESRPPWIQRSFPKSRKVYRVDSVALMFDMAKHGVGIAQIGCIIGDMEPQLYRIPARYTEPGMGLWVLSHVDLRTTARVRIFRDFLVDELTKQLDLIEGRAEGYGRATARAA